MLELAQGPTGNMFGWYLGLAIAFAVIVVVVILVASILTLAARINKQAQLAIEALDQGRITTFPLWDLLKVNNSAKGILDATRAARGALGG